jgi:predicted neuraminidase
VIESEVGREIVEGHIVHTRPKSVVIATWILVAAALYGSYFESDLLPLANFFRPPALWVAHATMSLVLILGAFAVQLGLLKARAYAWWCSLSLACGALGVLWFNVVLRMRGSESMFEALVSDPHVLAVAIAGGLVLLILLRKQSRRWFLLATRLRSLSSDDVEGFVKKFMKCATCMFAGLIALANDCPAAEPSFQSIAIFPAEKKHNHASCVVELPGGDLLATWYSGTGERSADDVLIQAARLRKGSTIWGPRFLLADTPGYPDCNPALFAAPDKTLWLFWPTILDHRWEGALLKFAVARDAPSESSPPIWTREGVLHITPEEFPSAMDAAIASLTDQQRNAVHAYMDKLAERSRDLLYQRLGWMPRVHPTVLPSGRWLLPLYSDTFSASIVAISDDRGDTWRASRPIIGFGNIQPSLVRKSDGNIVAFMRDNGPFRRIRVSTSTDDGVTWGPVTSSPLPNPGAGIEAIRLASGRWAMVYNDLPRGRHSLAVSLSDDEGQTWKWTRHIEKGPPGSGSFHYPSIIQGTDGLIHVTYTHGGTSEGSTIQHARFNEEWVVGDARRTESGPAER